MRTDHPHGARDVEDLSQLIAHAFTPRYADLRRKLRTDFRLDPATRPEYWRFVRRRGRMVAHVGLYEKSVRIGRAVLRTGGIGFVCCDPEYRQQGLAAVCLRDSLAVMRQANMPLSLLFGIDRYYTRFGFVGCLPRYTLKIGVRELDSLRNPFAVEPLAAADLDDLLRLYEAAAAATPGAVVRSKAGLRYSLARWALAPARGSRQENIRLFREKTGARRARAYVVWKDNGLVEAALAPGDERAAAAVLAWLREKRSAALERDVILGSGLCPAHPLWNYARRFNHTTDGGLSWTGGGMGCILDLPAFLAALQPEFEARLNRAGLEGEGQLHLHVDGVPHSLILGRGHALSAAPCCTLSARVTCSAQALLQMTLGTLPWQAIPGVKVEGEEALVRAVFPEGSPSVYQLDHF